MIRVTLDSKAFEKAFDETLFKTDIVLDVVDLERFARFLFMEVGVQVVPT